ncbi:MAG: metallophosphoesterase [Saprospiraceae bacterium]|nr:metallophosphoesterase [Saprospiraceae bacterium]
MNRTLFLIFIIIFFVGLDVYTYYGMTGLFGQTRFGRFYRIITIGLIVSTYIAIFALLMHYMSGVDQGKKEMFNFLTGFVFTMLVTKLIFSAIMLVQDGGRYIIGFLSYIKSLYIDVDDAAAAFIPERRLFITSLATLTAGIPFFGMLYGITKGKYRYTIERVNLSFKDLPAAFDGLRIVQISDIHSGSFDNKEKVRTGIEKINALKPDIVCFTGDLVNAEKEEIDPYLDIFSEIKSKYGKFAILGNHDYYGSWEKNNTMAEDAYFSDFFTKFRKMGFDLLNNENRTINIAGESIQLLGVENWGAGRWFPKKGDLDKALVGVDKSAFKILMSHDPTHWDEKVVLHPEHIHLTLSGHTHGFQFGFQLPGFKWSPAQYRYKKWLGLYQEGGKYLYVNRGFGFLGFPGRVGMWPEITLIELKRGGQNT